MKFVVRALLFLGFVSLAPLLHALIMRPLPIEELAQKSDLIVHGIVTNKTCLRDAEGRIYTQIELALSETWKGKTEGRALPVVYGGGTIGDERAEVSGQPDYAPGEEVILFLVNNPHGKAVTLGLGQGKFDVWRDRATGEKFAFNPFHGEPEKSNHGDAGRTHRLGLSELKQRVKEAQ